MGSDLLDAKLTGLRARQFVGDGGRVRVPGSILKLEDAAEGTRVGWIDSSDCGKKKKKRLANLGLIDKMEVYSHIPAPPYDVLDE